jgi:hypothetical protein
MKLREYAILCLNALVSIQTSGNIRKVGGTDV